MKYSISFLLIFALVCGFSFYKPRIPHPVNPYADFSLIFMTCGMGSNRDSKMPVINVKGLNYIYTSQQNGFWSGDPKRECDTICMGSLRKTSVDSIRNIVKNISDTSIYRCNVDVRSGVSQYLFINYTNKNLKFQMFNEGHVVAQQIVDILNSNLPKDKEKMWVSSVAEVKGKNILERNQ